MNIDVDASETTDLVADLSRVPAKVVAAVEAATHKAAHNIKTQMAADAENSGHYKRFSAAITYDRKFGSPTAIEYEVGPDKDRPQGALGNILYFGTSNNAPVLDFEAAPRAEEPKFIQALRAAAGDVL